MKAPEYYIGRPVESLQTMLRALSETNSRILPVIPNSQYNSNTYASVRSFQGEAGLPETGFTDLETWNELVKAYDRSLLHSTIPTVRPAWSSTQTVSAGEGNLHLYLVQAMLTALSLEFPDLTAPALTGVLDPPTQVGLRWIQAAGGLAQSGNLDTATWNTLSALYRTAIGNGTFDK